MRERESLMIHVLYKTTNIENNKFYKRYKRKADPDYSMSCYRSIGPLRLGRVWYCETEEYIYRGTTQGRGRPGQYPAE